MEVIMLLHPYIAARLVQYHRSEMEGRARHRRLRRQAAGARFPAKTKIPNQVPRHWRERYL